MIKKFLGWFLQLKIQTLFVQSILLLSFKSFAIDDVNVQN